ncbi:ribonuclease H-like domain-containing protein [Tanacetum coccineum]
MAKEDKFHDDNPPPPPPRVTPTQQTPHTLPTIKLPILKKVSTDTNGQIRVLPPKTAEEILARERERKSRTTLLMFIPEDHLAKFYKMTDAKEMWEAIKSRFGGNDESKKMQKYILSSAIEAFLAGVSTEDANQKFLRSLPTSWSQVSLIMRTKPGVDTLSFDDLYNNIKVFESDVKGSTASSSITHNVVFVFSESTSSTNDVSTTYGVSTSSGYHSQRIGLVDKFDLEEMDLKWQVAMISMRLKKFYKNTGRKLEFDAKVPIGFDKTKVECFNCHNIWHFAKKCRSKGNQESKKRDAGNTRYKAKDNGRRPGKQEEPKALVTINGDGVDWTGHAKDEQENFALMAYNNSGSNIWLRIKFYEGVLSYENEVLESVFDNRSSDVEDTPVYDRLRNESNFTYGPKQSKTSEFAANTSDSVSCESNYFIETLESVPKPAINEPIAVSKPKVWFDAPIIEEYESDSDDEYDEPQKALENNSRYCIDSDVPWTDWKQAYLVEYQLFWWPCCFGRSKGKKGSRGNTVMPELHNKMELLRGRT